MEIRVHKIQNTWLVEKRLASEEGFYYKEGEEQAKIESW